MAANATNTLQATITSTDANGNTSINRGLGNPSFPGNVGDMTINEQLNNGANVIPLPIGGTITGIQNIYVKNNAAPGGGTVQVSININGVGLVVVDLLQPGGVYISWNVPTPPVAASQKTGLTLTASVANIPVEYFLGG
jgi:hypothetical protein